jgi:hypothetical protein
MNHLFTIQQLFSERLFRIPDYQRGYAWEEQQLEEFVEDHYTGTIVLNPLERDTRFPDTDEGGKQYARVAVVDGQQRLTTFILILDAIRRVMAGIPSLAKRSEWIREGFIHVKDPTGQPIYRLILNSDSHDYFVKDVLSDTPSPEGPTISSHSRLSAARDHFASYLEKKLKEMPSDEYQDWIKRLQDKVLQRMKVTVYTVSDQAEVGVIFEVLNNRGKPLSELEKVKNYLLYLATKLDVPNSLAEAVNKAWMNIFQRLMRAGITDSASEDQLLRAHWLTIYEADKRYWEGSKSIKKRFNLKDYQKKHNKLRDDLLKYAKTLDEAALAYCDARYPAHTNAFAKWDHTTNVRDQVRSFSEKLRRVNVLAPFLPLFIAARLRFPENGEQYLELVKLCEVFAFRVYRLTNHRANAGQPRLFRIGHEFYHRKLTFDEALEGIRVLLHYYCPTSMFQAAFGPPDPEDLWYGWTGLKYFLYEYEEYLAKKADIPLTWEQVTRSDDQKTIEHILPQTPTPVWKDIFDAKQRRLYTNDIGNLCLTFDNSVYGNKPFDQKRGTPNGESWAESPCYANSNLFMERALASFKKWDEAALRKRRKQIVDWALQRWHVEEPVGTVDTPLDEDDDADE